MAPPSEREEVLKGLERDAIEKAVGAGGRRETCQVSHRDIVPAHPVERSRVRARVRVSPSLSC